MRKAKQAPARKTIPAQLAFNFDGYDEPSKLGVYVSCERLAMPADKSRAAAEIRIAFTPHGFLWAESVMLETQGFCSLPNVSDVRHGKVAATRRQAIEASAARIIAMCSEAKTKASRAVLAWVNTLIPSPIHSPEKAP